MFDAKREKRKTKSANSNAKTEHVRKKSGQGSIVGAALHAGGNWNNGSNCGSRCRNTNNYRWNTNSNIGARGCTQRHGARSQTPWLDPSALSQRISFGKTLNGALAELVGNTKVLQVHNKRILAKRYGKLFEKVVAQENMLDAYKNAKRGKSQRENVRRFNLAPEENLKRIRDSLVDRSFTTFPYLTKQIYEPKERTIYVLPFAPDRIVQHALVNVLEPVWDSMFIHNSYACRKGKGMHAGSLKTMEYVRRFDYCLKCDISKFYPSIVHDILFEIVARKIKCPGTLWLLADIIYSVPDGLNVPIGNYTSQWLGNLYMNELDRHLKHTHRVKAYLRYCDDFCLFSNDKAYLNEMAQVIESFCADRLQLRLSKCDLFPVSQGVDFLGYRHFRNYVLLRKSTAKRVRKRLQRLPAMLERGEITKEQFRSSIASTNGWLQWANTHNLKISLELKALMELTA